jgi:hypothetical protein
MKKILVLVSLIFLILGPVGSAYAIPYTDSFHPERYMKIFDVVYWTFDIADENDPNSFHPDTQDITSASIALNLSDDSGRWDFCELAYLNVGTNHFAWEVESGEVSFEIASLVELNKDGTVQASLRALWGDFYFNSAVLTAEGTDPDSGAGTAPVPECATIFLLGTGLVGLAAITRRKLNFTN